MRKRFALRCKSFEIEHRQRVMTVTGCLQVYRTDRGLVTKDTGNSNGSVFSAGLTDALASSLPVESNRVETGVRCLLSAIRRSNKHFGDYAESNPGESAKQDCHPS